MSDYSKRERTCLHRWGGRRRGCLFGRARELLLRRWIDTCAGVEDPDCGTGVLRARGCFDRLSGGMSRSAGVDRVVDETEGLKIRREGDCRLKGPE